LELLAGGVDEAGRGCVVGPLVVAGVSADSQGVENLREIGVRDSKLLSPRRRNTLYGEILKICVRVNWALIGPQEIDIVVSTGKKYRKLNYLEALYFAKVVDELEAASVTVDASDTSPKRFEDVICTNLTVPCKVRAYHFADRDYPLVSAASIIAKVERDRLVGILRERHGDFGSGYPSDPRTKIFFREWLEAGKLPPDWTRRSWKSWQTFEASLRAPF
jgi:ribonuclease HII